MIIGDLAFADDEVMGQNATHRFVESAADGFIRHLEGGKGLGAAGADFIHGFIEAIHGHSGGISLEISAGAVTLNGIAPLGDAPGELDFRFGQAFGPETVNADVSQSASAPTGSGDLTVGQIIALTVSAAVAIAGLWLYFRPKNKSGKIAKTAITPSRLKKAFEV
jgi:hypothetical protein